MASLLIVDDDQTVRDVLAELFSGEHRSDTASTAEEALGAMTECEYDLIITDITMPGMSGETLLGFARTNCPRTPVIFISGTIDRERVARLRVKGAFDFIQKPFQLSEVLEKVAHALEHRRRLVRA